MDFGRVFLDLNQRIKFPKNWKAYHIFTKCEKYKILNFKIGKASVWFPLVMRIFQVIQS